MSLYNMIYGMNTDLSVILSCILGFNIQEIPRFRNCFLANEDEEYDFLIYTRMGGGNYDCWNDWDFEWDYEEEAPCDCPYHRLLKYEKQDWYVRGYDDEYDNTYRSLEGKFNPEQKEIFEELKNPETSKKCFEEIITPRMEKLFPELCKKDEENEDSLK